MNQRKKSTKKCVEIPTTRDGALNLIYSVLDDINKTVDYCHAREIKKGSAVRAIMMSELRITIEARRHKVGLLLGVEEEIEMQTINQSALADAY